MKFKYLLITLLLSLCAHADADWFLRGTQNNWGATQMVAGGTNTVQVTNVVFTSAGSIKFDRFGDWKENYGVGGKNGTNIPVAAGTWTIKFFTDTKNWSISAASISSSSSSSSSSSKPIDPTGITIDYTNNRALVVDRLGMAIVALDLNNGSRKVLSDNSIPNTENTFITPLSIAIDATYNRALVVDSGRNDIIAVDLNTGKRSILSPSEPNQNALQNIAIDISHNRALVTDLGLKAVIAIDLLSGTRTILSDNVTPNDATPFSFPMGITIDLLRNRALISNQAVEPSIIAVDLTSGARTKITDDNTFNDQFIDPWGSTLDIVHNRLLVAVANSRRLFAIDLLTGARTIVVDNNPLNNVSTPFDVIIDGTHNRALFADRGFRAIYALDLTTGKNVFFAK